MIRHIVMFNYKEGFSAQENRENAEQAKQRLLALKDIIPGIVDFKVIIDVLPSGDRDIVLNTLFESEAALAVYQTHPEHVRAAAFVASVMHNRACVDYHE